MTSSLLFVVLSLLINQISGNKVNIDVYYETLCPDSIAFITRQLWPTYEILKDYMNITLIPFGKASSTGEGNNIRFYCQHGSNECFGNMIQSCAIHLNNDNDKTLPFINCMQSHSAPYKVGEYCANENKLNWSNINTCVNSVQGKEFLLQEKTKTFSLNPPMTFVPWIILNKVHTDEIQEKALSDLKNLICENIQVQKPNVCKN